MDEVWTDDTLESGSEREGGGLLSDEDGAESSETEAAAVTVKKRNARNERKKSSLFTWFPTLKAEESTTDDYGRQNYKVYRWRWFMLVSMFLLNISNGTVSAKTAMPIYAPQTFNKSGHGDRYYLRWYLYLKISNHRERYSSIIILTL